MDFLFNKVAALQVTKKRLQHGWFPVKFRKFFRTPSLQVTYSGCFSIITNQIILGLYLWTYQKHDYLPHGLLLSNIEAYLVNEKGLYLILNYLTNYR